MIFLEVTKQLNEGEDSADVSVSLNLCKVKALHASAFLRSTNTCKDAMAWLSMISKQRELLKQ